MRARYGFALLILLATGCTTLYEELPTQASAPASSPTSVGAPVIVTPTTLPTPGPGPTAAPQPTPTPASGPTPNPGSTPRPAPTPTPSTNVSIHHVRVGFFGFSCPAGVPVPRNGAGELPVGCRGFATATPKDSSGTDVPESVHGPNVDWNLEDGHPFVQVTNSGVTVFNKDVRGIAVGAFRLCATIRGVKGCLSAQVTPGL